jgi:hypothetical protein
VFLVTLLPFSMYTSSAHCLGPDYHRRTKMSLDPILLIKAVKLPVMVAFWDGVQRTIAESVKMKIDDRCSSQP